MAGRLLSLDGLLQFAEFRPSLPFLHSNLSVVRLSVVRGDLYDVRATGPVAKEVVSTKVVCDGPGDERALHVEAATA